MSVLNPRELKAAAGSALQAASCSPKKLVLIHTGATLALSLLLTVVNYLLEQQIGTTGGLSGMDLRSVLSTAQSVLQVAQSILVPFWNAGFLFAALGILRRREVSPRSLLEGFSRFGPILRLQLLQGLLYMLISMGAVYLSSFLFVMTPWAAPLMDAMEPLMADSSLLSDTDALSAAMMESMEGVLNQIALPLVLITCAVLLVALVPVFYRFRLAQYVLMDDGRTGALAAMASSAAMMKGNFLRFIRLDLSFWWYYLLELLATLVFYSDLILPLLGVTLPWSATVSFFGAFLLYLACMLALHWWKKSDLEVTYAAAYDSLKIPRQPQPVPKNQPWSY